MVVAARGTYGPDSSRNVKFMLVDLAWSRTFPPPTDKYLGGILMYGMLPRVVKKGKTSMCKQCDKISYYSLQA